MSKKDPPEIEEGEPKKRKKVSAVQKRADKKERKKAEARKWDPWEDDWNT